MKLKTYSIGQWRIVAPSVKVSAKLASDACGEKVTQQDIKRYWKVDDKPLSAKLVLDGIAGEFVFDSVGVWMVRDGRVFKFEGMEVY